MGDLSNELSFNLDSWKSTLEVSKRDRDGTLGRFNTELLFYLFNPFLVKFSKV
jgi:hypothetical protein